MNGMQVWPVVATMIALSPGALANDGTKGRYTLTPADGAFVRLDTQTGEVAICKRQAEQWACDTVAEDRRALQQEIDRLSAENSELKSAVRRLEEMVGLPDGEKPKTEKRAETELPKFRLPSEQDIDQAVGYVQRMMKKLKEKLRELEDGDPKSQKL
jgi:DnaJ-domain-containing protein 1